MKKDKTKFYAVQGIALMIISITVLGGYLINQSLSQAEEIYKQNYTYVSYEVLTDNVIPVASEITDQNANPNTNPNTIIKPYNDETVKIGKQFYDPKGETKDQENSIIYYEGTYIQNTGIDYVSKNKFQVVAVLDGKVLSVKKDDITGLTVIIDHGNDTTSTYQSLSSSKVKEGDTIKQGSTVGESGTNKIGKDLGNHLHFELSFKNVLVNPEKYYNQQIEEKNE